MTVRLENSMADELSSVAYDLNLSAAAFIRRSLRRAIEHTKQYELPLLNDRVKEALRPE